MAYKFNYMNMNAERNNILVSGILQLLVQSAITQVTTSTAYILYSYILISNTKLD